MGGDCHEPKKEMFGLRAGRGWLNLTAPRLSFTPKLFRAGPFEQVPATTLPFPVHCIDCDDPFLTLYLLRTDQLIK